MSAAVFFSGDTGLTTEYAAIRERFGAFDLVMLEVGAFHPAWGDIHLGPANALEALKLLGGGAFLVLGDLAARSLVAPNELPVGVFTALLGGPFFLLLLRRRRTDGPLG